MSARTRCPSGAGRRLSAGISRATGILQRRLCGHGIILDRRRLTGNGALLGQPGAEVDQPAALAAEWAKRSEEHTSELQSQSNLVCRLLLEKKKKKKENIHT